MLFLRLATKRWEARSPEIAFYGEQAAKASTREQGQAWGLCRRFRGIVLPGTPLTFQLLEPGVDVLRFQSLIQPQTHVDAAYLLQAIQQIVSNRDVMDTGEHDQQTRYFVATFLDELLTPQIAIPFPHRLCM